MFLTMSWFWRGFQSAIFYYVSCAPCAKLSYRRKRRKEMKRAKAEKGFNDLEGGRYVHPTPFDTNPFWQEEIDIGPGPPPRKAVRDGKGKPRRAKPAKGWWRNPGDRKQAERQLKTGSSMGSEPSQQSSMQTILEDGNVEQLRDSSEGWNRRRYQREDEILWGLENVNTKSTTTSSLSGSGSAAYQYHVRNPAVNDLHPPVVSTHPTDQTETRWMLQPPPKAKVMEGKQRADTSNRSRSDSGGSYRSKSTAKKASEISLCRQVGERLMESKIKRGDLPTAAETYISTSRGPSALSARTSSSSINHAQGQPHDRDPKSSLTTPSASVKRKTPLPPISLDSQPSLPSPPPARPPLSTIPSTSLPQKQKERPPNPRPLLVSSNSLHLLQHFVTPASHLNSVKGVSSPLSDIATNVKLPPASQQEDADLRLPEVDSWFPENGWDFPGSNDQRERTAQQRWSMDI